MAARRNKKLELIAKALAKSRPPDHHSQSGLDEGKRMELRAMDQQWIRDVESLCDALQEVFPGFKKFYFTTYIQTGRYPTKGEG